MAHRVIRSHAAESGQAMVSFALMMTALMGMLALVFDLGIVFSQRRFDQNGADAAAFAAGRRLATEVAALSSTSVFFAIPDSLIYQEVRRYAGLHPTNTGSAVPTGLNQSGMISRNLLTATLEYKGTSAYPTSWCYSPTGPQPVRTPPVPACALYQGTYPPLPAAGEFYRLRVTVSSHTNGLFAPIISANDNTPAAPTAQSVPACLPPHVKIGAAWMPLLVGGQPVPGNTICAQTVVVIKGSPVGGDPIPVIPLTTPDCNLTSVPGGLYPLWDPNPKNCQGNPTGSFKNYLDFSDEPKWCDGVSYNYSYRMPPEAGCGGPTDASWNRAGYAHDPARPGGNGSAEDISYWLGMGGFGGVVRPDTLLPDGTYLSDGNRFPTYVSSNPNQSGNLGTNIGDGLYCRAVSVTNGGNGCSTSISPSGTYFFAKNRLLGGAGLPCPDIWGAAPYNLGCRDTGVAVWIDPQRSAGAAWVPASNNIERVRIRRILRFRIYCAFDANGNCTNPPPGSAKSDAQGRFVSAFISGPCPTCTIGPSLVANTATLES